MTLSGTGSSAVGTSFTPSKSTYFTEPVGPFGSVVFENDTLVLIANLAKDTATSKYVVTGLNFSTVALTNYSPNYEWDSVDPATITLTTPASMTALPGVSINTTTKQVVFTNVTLNNLSSINPKAGTITINGTVGW